MKKKWLWLALVAVILAVTAVQVSAGVLTAGNYIYLINGQEQEFPVDIMTVQGTTMLPEEVMRVMGFEPKVDGRQVTLSRGPVNAVMNIGSDSALVEKQAKILKAGPVRIGGRLFIPAEILPYLGWTADVEGKFVVTRDWGADMAGKQSFASAGEYEAALAKRTVTSTLRGTTGAYAQVSITALTPELLADDRLAMPWGTRVKLMTYLKNRTLLLVTVKNTSFRTINLDPAKLLLTDANGRQYDYLKTEVAVDGTVTSTIAPGASRTSVLLYEPATGLLNLFSDQTSDALGQVQAP